MACRLLPLALLATAALTAAVTGCNRKADIQVSQLQVLGTVAQVSIAGLSPEQAAVATRRAEQALTSFDHIGYTFSSGGELQHVNEALANGRTVAVSDEMTELVEWSRQLSLASNGLFNPAAGEFTALWEFHCDHAVCDTPPPYPDEVQALVDGKTAELLRRAPVMDDVMVRGNRVSSRNRHARLEFGDLIYGLALDIAIRSLRESGAGNAMVSIGDDVHTSGMRADHAWWIGIPDADGSHVIGSIETTDNESVVTVRALASAPGRQGPVYRRIVDPRTGRPAGDIRAVTVVHDSAMVASAAATAFLVAGTGGWKAVADRMGVHALLLTAADGTLYTSPAIDHRIHWKQGITHQHLVP